MAINLDTKWVVIAVIVLIVLILVAAVGYVFGYSGGYNKGYKDGKASQPTTEKTRTVTIEKEREKITSSGRDPEDYGEKVSDTFNIPLSGEGHVDITTFSDSKVDSILYSIMERPLTITKTVFDTTFTNVLKEVPVQDPIQRVKDMGTGCLIGALLTGVVYYAISNGIISIGG